MIEAADRAIVAVAELRAIELAAAVRALGSLVKLQHYYGSDGFVAAMEHVGSILERGAHGSRWDDLACDSVKSIPQLRGQICGFRDSVEHPHSGDGKVREVPVRSGGTRSIWACDGCWAAIQGGAA